MDELELEIQRQTRVCELKSKISELKGWLESTDYIVIKYQEYTLTGKQMPDGYNLDDFSSKRDGIRTEINSLEEQLKELENNAGEAVG
jgi:chromosome segregation ATPase